MTCGCYHCERWSVHDVFCDNPEINSMVWGLMYDMTPNPWDKAGKPCASIPDIVDTVARAYGKRASKRIYIEVH
jgi:hypothetical protein